jgi:hypothetical protein
MVWNIVHVNEYQARSAIIPFVSIIIRKEHDLRQQCHFVFISRRVATKKINYLQPTTKCAAYSSELLPVLSGK